MSVEQRVEVRCPKCHRYYGWRTAGSPPVGYYCRDCKLEFVPRH